MSCIVDQLCLGYIDSEPWGIIIEIIIFLYSFAGLAIVCDKFLVPALETLCLRFNIREDVAGASFMAIGSAAPEVVITIIGVIQKGEADLGVGVSIGSGMIAFSILPALCSFSAGKNLILKRRPLARDALFYFTGIVSVTVFFADGYIVLWESALMVGLYVAYILTVILSPTMRKSYLHHNIRTKYQERLKEATLRGDSAEEIEKIKAQYAETQVQRKSFVLLQKEAREKELAAAAEAKRKERERKSLFNEKLSLVSKRTGSGTGSSLHASYGANSLGDESEDVGGVGSSQPPTPISPGSLHNVSMDEEVPSPLQVPSNHHVLPNGNGVSNGLMESHQIKVAEVTDDESDSDSISTPPASSNSVDNEDDAQADDEVLPAEDSLMELDEEEVSVGSYYFKKVVKIVQVLSSPLNWIISHTCINGEHDSPTANYYSLTIMISFMWVACFAFGVSSVAERWNHLSGLPLSLFGIVLVSIGAATPDCVGSMAVAKRGYGSMAMSNGVGAQVTNSLIGLGMPFLIYNLKQEIDYVDGSSADNAFTKGIPLPEHGDLFFAACFQFINVGHFIIILLVVALISGSDKAILTKRKGYAFIFVYLSVIAGFTLVALIWGGKADQITLHEE